MPTCRWLWVELAEVPQQHHQVVGTTTKPLGRWKSPLNISSKSLLTLPAVVTLLPLRQVRVEQCAQHRSAECCWVQASQAGAVARHNVGEVAQPGGGWGGDKGQHSRWCRGDEGKHVSCYQSAGQVGSRHTRLPSCAQA